MLIDFQIKRSNSLGRAGILYFEDGSKIETPIFMPVGSQGSVRSIQQPELEEIGYRLILGNTYHLYLRPGMEIISEYSGLKNFISWPHKLLTDSGGYQAFSLSRSNLVKYKEDGVRFRSHLDGSEHFFTPEKVLDIQRVIEADIVMPLDDCAPYPSSKERLETSLKRTHEWFKRSYEYFTEKAYHEKQSLFPILQGGIDTLLRRRSAQEYLRYDVKGYAIGGLSVGEKNDDFLNALASSLKELPHEKPKYLMGVGSVQEIIDSVKLGADMFDCVLPTRNARNGQLFTHEGKLNIRNEKYKKSRSPIDEECGCKVCMRYARGYLRHLHKSNELLAYSLSTYHNLYFMHSLMKRIRRSIMRG